MQDLCNNTVMNEQDWHWMQRALVLAEQGRGYVEPNPLVGAVVVRDNLMVGEGWHKRFGEAHAEVNALTAAEEAARGATLYVTLEPCCHQGRTPPCTDAILRAGIARVVVAMQDPFPQVAGQGIELLRAAGVAVDIGVGKAEAERLNAPYLKLLKTGRPYVHAKWAMSLDGKIATRTGDSKWISSAASRHWVHAFRGRMDAILIGGRTARADDPLLTARPPGPRVPVRIVLSSSGDLRLDSQLVRTAKTTPILVVTNPVTSNPNIQVLRDQGCEVLELAAGNQVSQLGLLLDELGRRRMTNILVEGGSVILGRFRDADALDEVHVFLAPRLLGGADAPTAMAGDGTESVAEALTLAEAAVEQIDCDILVHGKVRPRSAAI